MNTQGRQKHKSAKLVQDKTWTDTNKNL
jgi:hypothetical protein